MKEEKLKDSRLFTAHEQLDATFVKDELAFAEQKLQRMMSKYDAESFPDSASNNLVYPVIGNTEWTTSFYTGMLWLMYEATGQGSYREAALAQMPNFAERLYQRIEINHHDVGFLYSLSCMPAYLLENDEQAKKICIDAAELLITRYFDKAGIIQAWGDLSDPEQRGRMIIDCNMNLPLLYRASQISGDSKYYDIAYSHIKQAQKYIVREDSSTFHTYYMDVESGAAKFGKTAQGYRDDSCWARGQAWGVYGFLLSYVYTGDESLLETAICVTNYYLNRLPEDYINYWDLAFTSGDQPRDTSSTAIVCCGLLEMLRHLPLTHRYRTAYENATVLMMRSLSDKYSTRNNTDAEGLLLEGVYSLPDNRGVRECTIWGDYYYLEALVRLSKDWKMYW